MATEADQPLSTQIMSNSFNFTDIGLKFGTVVAESHLEQTCQALPEHEIFV